MQVEDVARISLAPRRTTQQQGDGPVGLGLLAQVVEDDQDVLAAIHPVLADGRTGVGGYVLEARGVGSRGGHDGGVLHGAGLFQGGTDRGDGGALLTDGHVDAPHLLLGVSGLPVALLVDDGVDGDGRLAGLPVADNQLTLAAADGCHGVDGLDAGSQGLVNGMPVHDVGGLRLQNSAALAFDFAQAVDRLAQGVDRTPQIAVTDGHRKHLAGPVDFLAFFDACEVAQDDHADLSGVQVEGQTQRAILKGQQLVGHATRQSLHMRNAVTGRTDVAHLLGGGVRRLVGLDELVERLAHHGGINGHFCHDHSLFLFLFKSVGPLLIPPRPFAASDA